MNLVCVRSIVRLMLVLCGIYDYACCETLRYKYNGLWLCLWLSFESLVFHVAFLAVFIFCIIRFESRFAKPPLSALVLYPLFLQYG